MTDKDIVGRNSQTLNRTFVFSTHFEFLGEKLHVPSGISTKIRELQFKKKISYSSWEEDYQKQYENLKEIASPEVMDYYDTNWHYIHEEWVIKLFIKFGNLLNFTNNRVESINRALKASLGLYLTLIAFVKHFFVRQDN